MANTKTGQAAAFGLWEMMEKSRHDKREELKAQIHRDTSTLFVDNGMDAAKLEQRWGRALSTAEVIQKLVAINPDLHFEVSINSPTKMGIYRTGLGPKRFLCGMENGVCPEFSILAKESVEVPDPDNPGRIKIDRVDVEQMRGWRTVLAMLILNGAITEAQADKYFHIHAGKDSERWQQTIHPKIEVHRAD